MTDAHASVPLLILLMGITIVLAVFVKVGLERLQMPPLLGFMALGALLHLADTRGDFLQARGREAFALLEQLGIICLLFRVGLESKLGGLVRELRRASVLWVCSVGLSGGCGYAVAAWVLGLPHLTSLFIGAALTATSVGMSIGAWHQRKLLGSREGQLLLDVVELDDVSAVAFMGILLAVAPHMENGNGGPALLPVLVRVGGGELVKLLVFGAGCVIFARYAEGRITGFLGRQTATPNLLLLALGCGLVITALGGILGISVAIGAFFAGLVFSRDPAAVRVDAAFQEVYDLFVPFLFIGVGLKLEALAFTPAVSAAGVLFVAAVFGKVVGTGLPALPTTGARCGLLLGVSMVPRAEIALLIMQQGHQMGPWVVSDAALSAMALACVATWIGTPFVLRGLFARWPDAVSPGPYEAADLDAAAPETAR